MVDQYVSIEVVVGTGDNKIHLYGTKLDGQFHLPPRKSSLVKVNVIPPPEQVWKNKLNGTFYHGDRIIIRVNGQPLSHAEIYTISLNEDGEYVISGHNAIKNLERTAMSASYKNASSQRVIKDAVKEAGEVAGEGVAAVKFFLPTESGGADERLAGQPVNYVGFPVTMDFDKTTCNEVIEQVCERNAWIWGTDRQDFIFVGDPDVMAERDVIDNRNLYNIIDLSPGLQQPSWSQVVVYGGADQSGGIETQADEGNDTDERADDGSGEENNSDSADTIFDDSWLPEPIENYFGEMTEAQQEAFRIDADDGKVTRKSAQEGGYLQNLSPTAKEALGIGDAENPQDESAYEVIPGSAPPSTEPVIGRAYIGSKRGGGKEGIIKGNPPGSRHGKDLDENDSGSTTDERHDQQQAQEEDNQSESDLEGPQPVYQWTDENIHTQTEADNMAAQILRSFWTKRKSGEIKIVGRYDIEPWDSVKLPPHDELQKPDLGGNSFLVTDVKTQVDQKSGWITTLGLGGEIDTIQERS